MKLKWKHPQGSNATKFSAFRNGAVIAASIAFLGGCSSPSGSSDAGQKPSGAVVEVPLEKPKITLAVPPEPTSEDLGMVQNGQIVRVGDMIEAVEATLKPTKDVYEFKEESPVDNDSVEAIGWESGNTNLGILTLRNRLILAIRTVDNVTEAFVNELIAEQERNFGKPQLQTLGVTSHYRFWARGNSRLMICDSMDAKERISVSIVIGQYELMDKLGMSAKQSEIDQRDADQILARIRPKAATR